jgi:hypothetical protein
MTKSTSGETKPQSITDPSVLEAYVIPFEKVRMRDVPLVGGKNASLGEHVDRHLVTTQRL